MQDLASRLAADGFLILHDFFPREAVAEVSERLDRLYRRFDQLPLDHAQDIATTSIDPTDGLRSAEINRAVRLDRGLKNSLVFRRCLGLARELRGRLAAYVFDHAIAKQPQAKAETPWHQDHAFTGHRTVLRTVHFWIPLQDVDEQNGCMHFIAGSHEQGLLPHDGVRNASGGITYVARGVNAAGAGAQAAPLKVGGLTVHTPLTLHYAGPNLTSTARAAWILHFGTFGWLAKLHPALVIQKYTRW